MSVRACSDYPSCLSPAKRALSIDQQHSYISCLYRMPTVESESIHSAFSTCNIHVSAGTIPEATVITHTSTLRVQMPSPCFQILLVAVLRRKVYLSIRPNCHSTSTTLARIITRIDPRGASKTPRDISDVEVDPNNIDFEIQSVKDRSHE
ncbi:hypothetical protein BD413DRAFT_269673 [Trametes elegans]|nr:hypothetical protein BD413DRAFT_269673 [Trametes elegans]